MTLLQDENTRLRREIETLKTRNKELELKLSKPHGLTDAEVRELIPAFRHLERNVDYYTFTDNPEEYEVIYKKFMLNVFGGTYYD